MDAGRGSIALLEKSNRPERILFEQLQATPPDAILKVIAEYQADQRTEKLDLGVGVYRDEQGETPILSTVKAAERFLVENQATKTYLGSSGSHEFNGLMQRLVFGEERGADERITTLQTPGGSGSLRVAAGVLLRAKPGIAAWAGEPTWANHVPLLGEAGIDMRPLPYYDADNKTLQFDAMLAAIKEIPAGDVVLLHGCCHNPTGLDLSRDQWQQIIDVVRERELLPFVDLAYQGFAEGLDADAFGVRELFDAVPQMIVASSCSKNFALYRDRVGALSIVSKSPDTAAIVRGQANSIVRTMYSMPPDHGAAVVAHILASEELRAQWQDEVAEMRNRLRGMREALGAALREKAPDHDFSQFERGNGMFSFVGISPAQVERIKKDHAVYMVATSRINIAGLTPATVGHLADAIADVIGA